MPDYSTKNIIDYAMNDDGVKFREELYGAIHDKVSAHIEAAKQAIAQNLIDVQDESEEETEEEITPEEE
jgi:basic membrane lipoprotein Med (substrate-binding protein (PBP1-ABC) superfamily)